MPIVRRIKLPPRDHTRGWALSLLVLVMLIGLPLAVWLDLRNLTETALRRQAADLNSVITSMRTFYASNVVGRVLAHAGATQVTHNYESIPGAIPIPATLSLELGRVVSEQQQNIQYRFVSDYPFKNRKPHEMDAVRDGRAGRAARKSRSRWSRRSRSRCSPTACGWSRRS
jgi:hypothetical protein